MQQTEFEKFYKQMIDLHRQKMFEMEMQFLESKHERKRGMSNYVLRCTTPEMKTYEMRMKL